MGTPNERSAQEPGIEGTGWVKTDMHCHACSKGFVAELDFDVDGNHVVLCPRCGHEHCRVIKQGKITSERWQGRNDRPPDSRGRSFWKSDVLEAKTTTASRFLRDMWLNRTDG